MDRKRRKMLCIRPTIAFPVLSLLAIAMSVFLAGCPDPRETAGVGVSGCHHEIDGVAAVNRTETSKLDCAAINDMVSSIPSAPEKYLVRSGSSGPFWKCTYHGTDVVSLLLRCELGQRHFSIVKAQG